MVLVKKNYKKIFLFLGVLVLLIVGAVFATENHYQDKFYPNSEFAGVDISNMSVEDATDSVMETINNKQVTVTENDQEIASIPLGDITNLDSATADLTEYFSTQHEDIMLKDLFSTTIYAFDINEHMNIDSEHTAQVLAEAGISNENRTATKDAEIQYVDGEGYSIAEEVYGTQFDEENVANQLYENQSINLNDAYIKPNRTSEDEQLNQAMDKINAIENTSITLNIAGNKETLPKEAIQSFIIADKNGNISIDTPAIEAYLSTYNDRYATYQKDRTFNSTLSGTVSVPGEYSTMGWSIDRAAEAEQITQDLLASEDVEREPAINGSHYEFGDGYGDSYIEVDLRNQQMFVYLDGKQALSTPIISGHPETTTEAGSYYIWNKDKDSTLNGYNKRTGVTYATPVNYWLPIDYVGQGIHDASWQTGFGGETYLTNGSNGCINVDPKVMEEVFNLSYVGMPVVMFY